MVPELLFAFGLISGILACSPTSGPLIANPTFQFDFSPPLGWTFYTVSGTNVSYAGQQGTASDAQRQLKNDIQAAILQAAQKMQISSNGWTWTTSGYTPTTSIHVIANGATFEANSYVPGLGAVLQQRGATATDPYTDYIQTLTVKVTSNNGIYFQSQWKNFADQVFSILSIQYNVYFRSAVTVS